MPHPYTPSETVTEARAGIPLVEMARNSTATADKSCKRMTRSRAARSAPSLQQKSRPRGRKTTGAAAREIARLEIDGNAALGGAHKAPVAKGEAKKWPTGGRWAEVESPSPKRKRAASSAAEERPSRRRKVATAGAVEGGRDGASPARSSGREQPRRVSAADADAAFLGEAAEQLAGALKGLRGEYREEARLVLQHLRAIRKPRSNRILRHWNNNSADGGDNPEAYVLSAQDARSLLATNQQISVPVFVANGANTAGIIDPDSTATRIHQVLNWFANPSETTDSGETETGNAPSIAAIKKRFQKSGREAGAVPWNLPDLPCPFHHNGMPQFLQQPSSNMLRDLVRFVADVNMDGICQDDCKGRSKAERHRRCQKHLISISALTEIRQGWHQWQGSVMLAEAGAVSGPHIDRWEFGTWLVCLEGEIGFGWLPNPTDDDRQAMRDGETPADDRWRYKILRANDALYMPPSTPHLVFRRQSGGPTLGLAGHVIRYADAGLWMELLQRQMETWIEKDGRDEDAPEVFCAFIEGLDHFYKRKKVHHQALADLKEVAKTL